MKIKIYHVKTEKIVPNFKNNKVLSVRKGKPFMRTKPEYKIIMDQIISILPLSCSTSQITDEETVTGCWQLFLTAWFDPRSSKMTALNILETGFSGSSVLKKVKRDLA